MKIILNTVHAMLRMLQFIADIFYNGYTIPSTWQSWNKLQDSQTRHRLKDNTCVDLRLIGLRDRKRYLKGFSRLSTRTNINRFHTFKSEFTEKELRYLLDIDNEHHLAIGAIKCNKNDLGIGIARYISQANDPTRAEAAIVVIDEYQGKGLGKLLYQELINRALENGIVTLSNTVTKDNRAMLNLLEQLGAQQVSENEQVYELELQLSSPTECSDIIPLRQALHKPASQNSINNTLIATI